MATERSVSPRHSADGRASIELSSDNDIARSTSIDKDEKNVIADNEFPVWEEGSIREREVVYTADDLVTHILEVEDDPTVNPWTFRMIFLGTGLAVFGSVLQQIFYFKPQTIYVSQVFLTVIAYVLGEFMALVIPSRGAIGRFFNPGPFNGKEHAAIALMASAAAQSSLATEVLAAQELFYGGYPSRAAGIFIVLSSQLIGFGIAGLLRDIIVRPTKMLWPMTLPISSLLESLHRDKSTSKSRIRIFYIVFTILFFWTIIPEWIFPLLEGVSIFCLAQQNSLVFTNLFGGASGNEGLGFLAFTFDWQYIASLGSPLWLPLSTLTNQFIGYLGCIILFMGIYYGNVQDAQNYPFLSPLLFNSASNGTYFEVYDQSLILDANQIVNQTAVDEVGSPRLTGTYSTAILCVNLGITATLSHMLLWNFDDIKSGWAWAAPSRLRKWLTFDTYKFWSNQETPEELLARKLSDESLDPHYRLMLRNLYKETPQWWWGVILVLSWAVGLGSLYAIKSTLPWWGFIIATIMAFIMMLFFSAQMGITGFQFNPQPLCQTLAGYMFPGRPLANMYFTSYSYNALQMGQVLARDLRLAQDVHLSPQCTFFVQVWGCVVGALFNFVIMLTIVDNQREILQGIQGSNIWSGQNFNTLAISWAMAKETYSIGSRYQWVSIAYLLGFLVPIPSWIINRIWPNRFWSYINTSIICWYLGYLAVGMNSSNMMFFAIGFLAQGWLRKSHPQLFNKYNYIVSAALDGGTQVMVFILTFAVFGGGGSAHGFPFWVGNPNTTIHNLDYCMVNPATAAA